LADLWYHRARVDDEEGDLVDYDSESDGVDDVNYEIYEWAGQSRLKVQIFFLKIRCGSKMPELEPLLIKTSSKTSFCFGIE
jgi:hypothetical protein